MTPKTILKWCWNCETDTFQTLCNVDPDDETTARVWMCQVCYEFVDFFIETNRKEKI